MQLPSIVTTNLRPSGVDGVSPVANRVIPVAPVNPSAHAQRSVEPPPGVVNMVNPALQQQVHSTDGEPVYTSVPDPVSKGTQAAAPKDWTIHRPAPEKVENPLPKPLSQVLMDHLRSMWTASASAIQIEQIKEHITPTEPTVPTQVPGDLARQVLTYEPAKIKKTENV